MAGARPQQRASGITGVHVWLIVFVCLFLASTTFLVLMFTNQEQLRQEVTTAQNKLKSALGPDAGVPAITAMQSQAASANKSLAKLMYETLRAMSTRLTGVADDNTQTVETKWNAIVDDIASGGKVPNAEQIGRSTGAIPALQVMYEWFVAENQAKTASAAALDETNKRLEEAQARNKELEEDFKTKLDELDKKVARISADKDDFNKTKTAEIDDLGKNISAKKDELTKLAADMRSQAEAHQAAMGKYEQTMAQQSELLAAYRSPGPEGTNELDTARKPVGRILRARPGDPIVHIDLGKVDGVKLGMPFAVYSYEKPVPPDGHGKATLEVVGVGAHTAECRIVTPPPADEPILEDDLVGNILLSRMKSKRPRFVIIGDFDSDYDGASDPAAYDKIVAFVKRFGGDVVEDVDATTDYVIRGRRPDAGPAPAGGARDQTAATKTRRAAKDAVFYDRSIRQGQALGIPRLSQDQFFNFVGIELGRGTSQRLEP